MLSVACCRLFVWLTLTPWSWTQYESPKCRWTSTRLHGVTSKTTAGLRNFKRDTEKQNYLPLQRTEPTLLSYPVYARTINPPEQICNKRIMPSFCPCLLEKWKLNKGSLLLTAFFPSRVGSFRPCSVVTRFVFSVLLSFYPGYKETLPVFRSDPRVSFSSHIHAIKPLFYVLFRTIFGAFPIKGCKNEPISFATSVCLGSHAV
jgi:hypothetical protein